MSRARARLAGAALVALALAPQLLSRTIPDTAWLLHAAERMLQGDRLYVDLVDVNPPLVVWLNLPVVLAARALGISDLLVYQVGVAGLALVSTLASIRMLRPVLPEPERRLFGLLLLFGLVTLAREDYGEREHLMLALALPYIMLTVRRLEGLHPRPVTAVLTGLAGGVGIALKPYFVLLWLSLEGCLLWRLRARYRPRMEAVLVVLVCAAYLAAVVRWSPEYFDVVRLMAGPYYAFLSNSLPVTALLGDGAVLALAAMLGYLALRPMARHPALWAGLAAATLGLYASAVLQHKGWRYHFYPSLTTGTLLLGLMAIELRGRAAGLASRLYARVAMGITLTVVGYTAIACVVQALDPYNPRYDADPDIGRLAPAVRARAGDGGVLVLSWSMASTFPLMRYSGTRSVSRFNTMWMPGAIYREQIFADPPLRYHDAAEMGPLERYLFDAVVKDFATGRPRLLLVLRPAPDRREWGLRRLDYLAYFGRDPRFARLFARYRYTGMVGEYWLFERLPEGAPDEPPRARRVTRPRGS